MATALHALFVRHHLTPSGFYALPRGEQIFLIASIMTELETDAKR